MPEAVKYTLLAVAAVLCTLPFKKYEPALAGLAATAAGIAVCAAALGAFSVVLGFLERTGALLGDASEAVEVLLKVLGITAVTRIGAQICRDGGESALAMKLELLGNVLALAVSLPLAEGVLAITTSFFGVG